MPLKQNQFYCVKCQKKVSIDANDICSKKIRNKKTHKSIDAVVAKHDYCGTKLFKFIKKSASIKSRIRTCRKSKSVSRSRKACKKSRSVTRRCRTYKSILKKRRRSRSRS
jgi:hypothetical protein